MRASSSRRSSSATTVHGLDRLHTLANGLPLHRVELPGTRAVTVLVAFEAGARTERPEENGMAHFLEHLVFKGGEKYDDYRKVNETAERMGAMLNAYTSHDLVAFHITCRAEVVGRRDRPADRLRRPPEDRRRGARPRARRRDPGDRALQRPAVGRRRAPDRPRRVRRPPARAARARPRGAPAHVHARGDRRVPQPPVGGRPRRRVPGRQPRLTARRRRAGRAVRPLPVDRRQRRLRARAGVRAADAGRGARLQPVAPAHLLPPDDRPARRASRAPR